MVVKRRIPETNKYDWIPGQEGRGLIYKGRTVDPKTDPGVWRVLDNPTWPDVLRTLYDRKMLEGQALKDAETLFGKV